MRYRLTCRVAALFLAVGAVCAPQLGHAQFPVRWNVANGDYGVSANWDPSTNAPPESRYNETALIEQGGTAQVNGLVVSGADGAEATPGALDVVNGTLRINAAGRLRVVADALQATDGSAVFGRTGTLSIASGGRLAADSLTLGGVFQPTITASGFTPVAVTDAAVLGGQLQVEFSGFVPNASSSWPLVEANSLTGEFDALTANGITLAPGQVLAVRQQSLAGGRVAAELFIDQLLTLRVDRGTGEVTIRSPGAAMAIDSYRVRSGSGALNSSDAVWNSLAEQLPGGQWRESNPSSLQLAELKASGVTQINTDGYSLGNVYVPPQPTAFREQLAGVQDLTFDYSAPDGVVRKGVVEYVGAAVNDLLLTVDPDSGRVQLSNPSGFDVAIEAYAIRSAAGALTPAGWTSLDDRDGAGGWRESNPSSRFVAELLQDGEQPFPSGTRYDLGTLFSSGAGVQDIEFEFLLAGETRALLGTVLYDKVDEIPNVPGDFTGNGVVDGRDLLAWQRGFGAAYDANDLADWGDGFGAAGGRAAAASAVPEPAALGLALGGMLWTGRRRRC